MRTLCKILAIAAIVLGMLLFALSMVDGHRHDPEVATVVGSMLFGSGLISLTIIVCTEPRWPADDRSRRGRYSSTADDDIPHDFS